MCSDWLVGLLQNLSYRTAISCQGQTPASTTVPKRFSRSDVPDSGIVCCRGWRGYLFGSGLLALCRFRHLIVPPENLLYQFAVDG